MNKLVYVPYEDWHLDAITLHQAFDTDPLVKERFMDAEAHNPALTILAPDEGTPLACVMGVKLYEGVYELCSLVDKSVDSCALHYIRSLRFLIEHEFERRQINRFQMFTRADMPWSSRFPTALGFSFEGRLRRYGADGADYHLFSKVRE